MLGFEVDSSDLLIRVEVVLVSIFNNHCAQDDLRGKIRGSMLVKIIARRVVMSHIMFIILSGPWLELWYWRTLKTCGIEIHLLKLLWLLPVKC